MTGRTTLTPGYPVYSALDMRAIVGLRNRVTIRLLSWSVRMTDLLPPLHNSDYHTTP